MLHAVGEDRQDSGSENMLAEDLVRTFLLSIESVFSLLRLQRQTERHSKPCHRNVGRVQRAG